MSYVLTMAFLNPSSFANTASLTCDPRGTATLPTGSQDRSSEPNCRTKTRYSCPPAPAISSYLLAFVSRSTAPDDFLRGSGGGAPKPLAARRRRREGADDDDAADDGCGDDDDDDDDDDDATVEEGGDVVATKACAVVAAYATAANAVILVADFIVMYVVIG